ncbi:MAG: hypothetical protein LBS30_03470, partial [Planctomycetota bacterium]|nr:hypothetical protein [Planctomycetota bacterium]
RDEPFGPVDTGEQVLYVSPPISVENRYVPYPGAAPQMPPPAFRAPGPAQNRERGLHAAAAPAPDPRAVRQAPPRERQRQGEKLPWWKSVLH